MSTVNFGPVLRDIASLARDVQVVSRQVDSVQSHVEAVGQLQVRTQSTLDELAEKFEAFVRADALAKQLQRAETQIIQVNQEIEKQFGHHDTLRHSTTGILQASDVGIVRLETILTGAEQRMTECPRYWLAPALIALAAWLADDRTLAERALAEAVRRDDCKASLFFALVHRRAGRMEGCVAWLERYFQMQDPGGLDREVIVMLNAVVRGVFGGAALVRCTATIDTWMSELETRGGFADQQRKRWAEVLDVMAPTPTDHPNLRKYSSTWPKLATSLAAAGRNRQVLGYFERLFTGEIVVPPGLEAEVDGLLDKLVKDFDDEELPLRREKLRLELIKKHDGDVAAADAENASRSKALEERTDFAELLTNAAMDPKTSGADIATQRYAVSRCRHWILAGHQDLVARDRARIPATCDLAIGSWKGSSRDGFDEKDLAKSLRSHYSARIADVVEKIKLGQGPWIALVAGVLIGGVAMLSGSAGGFVMGIVIAGAAVAFFQWQKSLLPQKRKDASADLENEQADAERILKACLAELTDVRRETAREDALAQEVADFLSELDSPQFVLQSPDKARGIVA